MELEDIQALPVGELADTDCILFLSKTQRDNPLEEKPSVKLELWQMKAAKSEKSKAPMQQEAVR